MCFCASVDFFSRHPTVLSITLNVFISTAAVVFKKKQKKKQKATMTSYFTQYDVVRTAHYQRGFICLRQSRAVSGSQKRWAEDRENVPIFISSGSSGIQDIHVGSPGQLRTTGRENGQRNLQVTLPECSQILVLIETEAISSVTKIEDVRFPLNRRRAVRAVVEMGALWSLFFVE